MRLSWNEIRARAARFADEWRDAHYEKGETQSFYNAFFEVFGVSRRSVARYEQHVTKLDDRSGYIDLFWPGVLMVEQKSAGRDLQSAYEQAGEYFDALPEGKRPRYILACDFQRFELYDLNERQKTQFALAELPKHVEKFGFIVGVKHASFRDQDPVNIAAAELMGELHDTLKASGYGGHDLEVFLVRIVFCLFADDTGIFERDIFLNLLEERTGEDGADLGGWLARLFQVLNTDAAKRQRELDEDLARFPYINGDLFAERLSITDFNAAMRKLLITACEFDWSNVSPAIFGALFQSVMAPAERRAQGAHYTTEKNILKVIGPLFMDDLRAEFERLKKRRDSLRKTALQNFQKRLGEMTFFDPACGCGNFLIIAYRELRELEIEVLKETRTDSTLELDAADLSLIRVNQFYGIEIGEFSARIAETALWMMDHIMNNKLSMAFGQSYVRIPLGESPHILHADALETDWGELLPPQRCDYVFGNPPFGGAKYQSPEQRAQVHRIAALGKSKGTLDYVTAWFLRAGEYINEGTRKTRIGLVATNSIAQGQQVAQLWPLLFDRLKLEIAFAHRTFAWGSDARGKAHVHVVIIGLDKAEAQANKKRLFTYPDIKGDPQETRPARISPYLIDAGGLTDPHLTVEETATPINGMPKLVIGSKPIDNGHYIFKKEERAEFLEREPGAKSLLRPFVGGREFLQGGERWILALHDVSPSVLAELPEVRERIAAVRKYRENSKSKPTQKLAETPTLYHINVIPDSPFLVIPKTSSERREYVPIGWLQPPIIPTDSLRVFEKATLTHFAFLTSSMHMTWMRTVTGRMKSDYAYSIGIVYNTFPMPPKMGDPSKLEPLARAVLDARAGFPDATLAELYDPDLMPAALRRAHQNLDRAVDRLYKQGGFASERARVEHLFALYEKMRVPLAVKRKRGRGG